MRIFKILTLGILILFFTGHLVSTLLFTLPANLTPDNLSSKAKIYMAPVFDQSWSLFAPVPEVNKKVYVSYLNETGIWSGWKAPFDKYQLIHQSNPMSASGKVVLLQSSILHYLYDENILQLKEKSIVRGDTSSGYFKVLRYSVTKELEKGGVKEKKIKMMVYYQSVSGDNKKYCIYYPGF